MNTAAQRCQILLIAATAERRRVTVLHYDHEYDLIASVTGQEVHWIVPRGTAENSSAVPLVDPLRAVEDDSWMSGYQVHQLAAVKRPTLSVSAATPHEV